MSSISQYDKVLVPKSHIKSPGAFFKFQSEPLINLPQQTPLAQGRLVTFKPNTASSITINITPESRSDLENPHSSESLSNPDKFKTVKEEMSNVLFYANEMLSRYGITLKIENCEHSKEAYDMLAVIIPEVCLFPADFFAQIKLKQFIICGTNIRCTPLDSTKFSIELHADSNKISQRLYQIIWNHIVEANPEIVDKWTQLEAEDDSEIPEETFSSLEDVFIDLMSPNHVHMESLLAKMRGVLQSCYPKTMPGEVFDRIINSKSKGCSVAFGL